MCGIVYRKSFEGLAVNQSLVSLYKNQRNRGTQGFGFYIPEQNKTAHETREDRILRLLNLEKNQASEILYHHRFPTSTANVINACHPFSTSANAELFDHEYVMVHNGWLTNDHELKQAHNKMGIAYVSEQPDGRFNDSEALLYDLALWLDGKQSAPASEGAVAFILLRDGELFYGRNAGSPLKLKMDGHGIRLASEGAGKTVPINLLHRFDAISGEFTTEPMSIPEYSYTSTYTSNTYSTGGSSGWGWEGYSQEVRDLADVELEYFDGNFEQAAEAVAVTIQLLASRAENTDDLDEVADAEARIKQLRKVSGAIWALAWELDEEARAYESLKGATS